MDEGSRTEMRRPGVGPVSDLRGEPEMLRAGPIDIPNAIGISDSDLADVRGTLLTDGPNDCV